jgi:Zn-finger nucleic acid-binding protein
MKCPVCTDVDLTMSERQGIEIDYCPKCRGVWLDRGELDKIVERSAQLDAPAAAPPPGQRYPTHAPPPPPPYRDDDQYKYHKHQKRKSFWSEIFD